MRIKLSTGEYGFAKHIELIVNHIADKLDLNLMSENLFNRSIVLGRHGSRSFIINVNSINQIFISTPEISFGLNGWYIIPNHNLKQISTKLLIDAYIEDRMFALMTVYDLITIRDFFDKIDIVGLYNFLDEL